MNDERDLERIEQLLRRAASDLRADSPPTPPIAASVHRQLAARRAPRAQLRLRLIRATALAVGAFVVLLLISPDAREAVARFFGLNTVRVQQVATLPAPTPSIQPTLQPSGAPATHVTRTPTPAPQPAGLTTLAEARAKAGFEIPLPAYPAGLGDPARVYFQDFSPDIRNARQVILVYPDFVLYEAQGVIYRKSIGSSTIVEEVEVNGRTALWLSGGEHMIQVSGPSGEPYIDFRRIEGNVLAWEAGEVTYRIETKLPLDEALRIAESIP